MEQRPIKKASVFIFFQSINGGLMIKGVVDY